MYYVDGLAMYVGYETYTSGVHIAAVNISCMLQTPELTAAIENSYRTFAVYPLRTDTGPCSCCHSPQDNHRLCAKPLRMLGPKDLRTYAYDALYTWGDEVDFKHFLPRIMELLAQANGDGPAFVDPESVFHKLSYQSSCSSGWRTWPPEEQRAIADYTLALWGALLDSEPTELSDSAFSWLCAFAQAADDLSPYLQQWMAASSANAHRNLAHTILWEGVPNSTCPRRGYWEQHQEQWRQVVDWLRTPAIRAKLRDAVERWKDAPFAGEFLEAAVLLS